MTGGGNTRLLPVIQEAVVVIEVREKSIRSLMENCACRGARTHTAL